MRRRIGWAWAGLVLLATLPARALPDAEHAAYAVIVSPNVPVSNVTLADATRLLLGERRFWQSGLPVVVLLPAVGSPERRFLLEHLFHMSEQGYRRHMLELLYRGELDYAPKVVDSRDELFEFTAASPGVVSIVPASESIPSTVHVLRIDGRAAGSPGYALQ